MILMKIFIAFSMTFFGAIVLAQSGSQIISLMNAGEFEAARKMSLSLIKNNDPIAFYTLGHLDYRKKTPEGDKSAFQYLLQAAKLDVVFAMNRVGFMYLNGIGVDKDLHEGEIWLTKASDRGEEYAIYNLGLHFYGQYGGEQKPQLALDQFLKIINRKELEQTEDWTMSAFYIGILTLNSNEQRGKELSESAFSEVLKSKLSTQRINWAKREIAVLVEKNLTKAGKGDGSDDDKLCQGFGFQVLSVEYPQCRLKVELAKREANDRQRIFELAKRQYDDEMARYEQQKAEIARARERRQSEAMLKFGLALMGGASPRATENFANAGRQMFGIPPVEPPRPKIENFTIINRGGQSVNCTVANNIINCF